MAHATVHRSAHLATVIEFAMDEDATADPSAGARVGRACVLASIGFAAAVAALIAAGVASYPVAPAPITLTATPQRMGSP
jgi:hypothetical protein